MSQDEQHLNLLSIFHFVMAAVTFLLASIPILHIAIGYLILTGPLDGSSPPPAIVGWLFMVFGAVFVLFGWIVAALTAVAGLRLKQRRSRIFCMVIAAIQCLNMPLGTILGVFTLIVLSRPSVVALFEGVQTQ